MRAVVAVASLLLLATVCVAETDIRFDFKGFLAGAPTGCNCGDVPGDCSSCLTGINGWKCRPRDCTFCSHGIHGFPCGGSTCDQCEFGINGWRCQIAATFTVCLVSFQSATAPFDSAWQGFARYEIVQQNDRAWAKFLFGSNLQVREVVIRNAANDAVWQVYPQDASQVGTTINWGRLPASTQYAYASFSASTAAFSPINGRVAPAFLIPTSTVPIFLWVAANSTGLVPAPAVGANQFQCQTSTSFQADAINAAATGSNFKRATGTDEWHEATRHLHTLQG